MSTNWYHAMSKFPSNLALGLKHEIRNHNINAMKKTEYLLLTQIFTQKLFPPFISESQSTERVSENHGHLSICDHHQSVCTHYCSMNKGIFAAANY